ncbi:hypothetical protein D3C72_1151010 [compost metagenome]
MVQRLAHQFAHHGARAQRSVGQQQVLRAQAMRLQHRHGQIAAADAQVLAAVAQHIGHLQGLAEADPAAQHRAGHAVPLRDRTGHVGRGHARPEFAHAAGDKVGVAVQFLGLAQRDDAARAFIGEGAQVEFHPFGQRRHDLPHRGLVGRLQLRQHCQRVVKRLEQDAFVGLLLPAGHFRGEVRHGRSACAHAVDLVAQRQQQCQPLFRRDQRGIGNGVRGACEQVGQANRIAHARGQHAQCQVERTRDAFEQRTEEERPAGVAHGW